MSADNTPDFDSMSPEELMAWMETLAERQGAVEGFTTDSRMEIDEVDPDSVEVEDNYIPYGMSEEDWAKKKAEEEATKAARLADRDATIQKPADELPPVPEATGETPEPPTLELPTLDDFVEETEIKGSTADEDGLDWLSDLAGDQGLATELPDLSALGQELNNLDLGNDLDQLSLGDLESLTAETEISSPEPEATVDPMDWLDNLASGQDSIVEEESDAIQSPVSPRPPEPAAASISDPEDQDVDPLEWLESLAKQQGADEDELITSASVDVPQLDEISPDVPGYTDYTVESEEFDRGDIVPSSVDTLDTGVLDDPAAWLESLAESQNEDEAVPFDFLDDSSPLSEGKEVAVEGQTEEIMERLNRAEDIPPEEMGNWFANLLEKGVERDDVPDYIGEEEEETTTLVEAHIPDWFVEQVGPPPGVEAVSQSPTPESGISLTEEVDLDDILDAEAHAEAEGLSMDWLENTIDTSDVEVEIPDWLQDEQGTTTDDEDIFAPPSQLESETLALSKISTTELDISDPWVEAFEIERQEGLADTDKIPEWYEARLSGIPVSDSVPLQDVPTEAEVTLQPANLAQETELPSGEPEGIPSWMSDSGTSTPTFTHPAEASWITDTQETDEDVEIPDWLREQAEAETPDQIDVPDWLDTIEETTAPIQPTPTQAAIPAANSPAPPVPLPENFDVNATLERARHKMSSGDVPNSLVEYEMIVRVNARLDDVVKDLAEQVKSEQKDNAAVYRVLGDGLMRQGKLQDALDTYRKALNLL